MTFVYYLALSYLAASLVPVGVYHGARLGNFSRIVQSHRIVPAVIAVPLAILVAAFELVAGATALAALFNEEAAKAAGLLFSICAAVGLALALYVYRLLRHPEGITSCGCSAFASPLTIASVVPALTLLLVSLLGLATTALGLGSNLNEKPDIALALPMVWGGTLALIINLLPASMPRTSSVEW